MDRYEARKAIVKELEEEGYLVRIEAHEHNVGTHDRCHKALYPCILLNRMRISCSVLSNACPICSCPVIFGGGITIVNGYKQIKRRRH